MKEKSTARLLRVVFAGGGTGGHLFPGIAVARELIRRHPGARVVFAGTGRAVETRVLGREGFALETVRSTGVMGKSLGGVGRALALAPVTLADAARVLRRTRPNLVVGLGGYSAGPVVLLAALRGLPTMLMEQNAVPGFTNRLLARVVGAAAVSFEATQSYFGAKAFVSGNPVRAGFFRDPRARAKRGRGSKTVSRLLVIGGSQGAHTLNLAMIEAAPVLAAAGAGVTVVHQAGDRDADRVRAGYQKAGVTARVEAFLDAMDEEMGAADLAVCRAGATTLAEVSASGLPAIVVPLPRAANDHQRRNAAALADVAAVDVVEEVALSHELAPRLVALLDDRARRDRMSTAIRAAARPDAARLVVDRVEELVGCAPT